MATGSPGLVRIDEERLRYDGTAGSFMKLHIANLLLTIVTLGIFRFWARTRERRYVWGTTSFLGDRFEYTGTGRELFIGFLKVILLFAVITAMSYGGRLLAQALSETPEEIILYTQLLSLPAYVAFYYLTSFGTFSARRYRMSRTLWRGVRFAQEGSAFQYANMALVGILLSIVTLGFYVPIMVLKLRRYEYENLRFGTARFHFTGDLTRFRLLFLICWVLFLLGTALVGWTYMAGGIQGLFGILLIVAAYYWFQAQIHVFTLNHIVADNLHASFDMQSLELFFVWLTNGIMVTLTFGLLRPLAVNRMMRIYASRMTLNGTLDLASIMAAPGDRPGGEGLAGVLDIDAMPG